MLYRYELYMDDEYQEVGFIQELSDIFSKDRAKDLCFDFDRHLKIPEYNKIKERTCAFFTEYGVKKFKNQIKAIIKAYEEETTFTVKCIKVSEDKIKKDILYSDKNQVIVREKAIHPEL